MSIVVERFSSIERKAFVFRSFGSMSAVLMMELRFARGYVDASLSNIHAALLTL
jgi:hypothetical protein